MTYPVETAKRENIPVYYVSIDGVTTKEYSTHPVQGAVLTKVICMRVPEGTAQKLTPRQNKATHGEFRIRLIDIDNEITDLVATDGASPTLNTLINRKMVLYAGYRTLTEVQFVPIFTGEIREISLVAPLTYEFKIVEPKRRFEDRLMTNLDARRNAKLQVPTIALAQPAFPGQTSVTLENSEDLELSGPQAPTVPVVLHQRTGLHHQQMNITNVDTTSHVVSFDGGVLGTYPAGAVLSRGALLSGNLVNIFYALMADDFQTAPSSNFPLLSALNTPNGLGLTADQIDSTKLQDTRDKLLSDYDVEYLFTDTPKARQFFEREIYPLGFFPTIGGDGTVGIRAFTPQGPEVDSPAKIHKEHMVSFPKWARLIKQHFNEIHVEGDFDAATSDFAELFQYIDSTDQTNTRENPSLTIQSKGLRSATFRYSGTPLAQEIAFRQLRRWLTTPIEIEASLLFTKREIRVGDMVSVSHPALPDTVANSLGITDQLMEVIEARPDPPAGLIRVKLFNASFQRFAFLGPASMASYGAATDDEKQYAYWGDTNNKVNGGTEDGYLKF